MGDAYPSDDRIYLDRERKEAARLRMNATVRRMHVTANRMKLIHG